MVEVELIGVRVELPSNTPVLVLRERAGRQRTLSIFIGAPEATAIAFALEGVEVPRPLTHDLLQQVLEDLGASLDRVVVNELRDTTFFAELHLSGPNGDVITSARPSDAVALASRIGCPIFVAEDVLAEAAVDEVEVAEPVDDANPEEVVEEFRNFIDQVNPDDFSA